MFQVDLPSIITPVMRVGILYSNLLKLPLELSKDDKLTNNLCSMFKLTERAVWQQV